MEQRTYHGAITVEGLADYLVAQFDPQEGVQAQKLGSGNSVMVQIGHGDTADELKHALSVGIARSIDDQGGVLVTLGQQQWISPKLAGYVAMMGLVSIMITPWALFGLIWPLSELYASTTLPREVWHAVEMYATSQGAAIGATQKLTYPHVG